MITKRYFLLSFTAHLLLLISAILLFKVSTQPKKNNDPVIKAYVYQSVITPKEIKKIEPTTKPRIMKRQQISQPISQKSTIASPEINHESFLKILHDKIASHQTYPESALILKQNGKVKVGFKLYPDGRVDNFKIIQSSGIESLDVAALDATQAISPVIEAGQYLKKPDNFSIDVIYD